MFSKRHVFVFDSAKPSVDLLVLFLHAHVWGSHSYRLDPTFSWSHHSGRRTNAGLRTKSRPRKSAWRIRCCLSCWFGLLVWIWLEFGGGGQLLEWLANTLWRAKTSIILYFFHKLKDSVQHATQQHLSTSLLANWPVKSRGYYIPRGESLFGFHLVNNSAR